ncbi:hypothetical protein [Streptomyces sp. NPDC059994]|uniref:hypothetical protein n=1 Tax=Streptomyces sp. NPDC059994 TaxID=3347029 RepID=UPI0036B998C3
MKFRDVPLPLLVGALTLGLSAGAVPLSAAVAADTVGQHPVTAVPVAAVAERVAKIGPGSEVLSAGADGFLSRLPSGEGVWTRYADGTSNSLGQGFTGSGQTQRRGAVSDLVAIEVGSWQDLNHRVILKDMAAGTQTVIDLPRRTSFLGMAGSVVVTSPEGSSEVHLLESVHGTVTDRHVTGCHSDARRPAMRPSAQAIC